VSRCSWCFGVEVAPLMYKIVMEVVLGAISGARNLDEFKVIPTSGKIVSGAFWSLGIWIMAAN
jgi:hypothetical protein